MSPTAFLHDVLAASHLQFLQVPYTVPPTALRTSLLVLRWVAVILGVLVAHKDIHLQDNVMFHAALPMLQVHSWNAATA